MAPRLGNMLPDTNDQDAIMAFMTDNTAPARVTRSQPTSGVRLSDILPETTDPAAVRKWYGLPSDDEGEDSDDDEDDDKEDQEKKDKADIFPPVIDKHKKAPQTPTSPKPKSAKAAASSPSIPALIGATSPTPMAFIKGHFPSYRDTAANNRIIQETLIWIALHRDAPHFRSNVKLIRSNIISHIKILSSPAKCDPELLQQLEDAVAAVLIKKANIPAKAPFKPVADPVLKPAEAVPPQGYTTGSAASSEHEASPDKPVDLSMKTLEERKNAFMKERRLERAAEKSKSPPLALERIIEAFEANFEGESSPSNVTDALARLRELLQARCNPAASPSKKQASPPSEDVAESIEVDEPIDVDGEGSEGHPIAIEDDKSDEDDSDEEDNEDSDMTDADKTPEGEKEAPAPVPTPAAKPRIASPVAKPSPELSPDSKNPFPSLNYTRTSRLPLKSFEELKPTDDEIDWERARITEQLLGEYQKSLDRKAAEAVPKDAEDVDITATGTSTFVGRVIEYLRPANFANSSAAIDRTDIQKQELEEFHMLVDYLSAYIYVHGFLNVLVEHFRKVRRPTTLFGQAILSWCGAERTTYQIFAIDPKTGAFDDDLDRRNNPTVLIRHPFQRIRLIGVYNRLLKKSLNEEFKPFARGAKPKALHRDNELRLVGELIREPSKILGALLQGLSKKAHVSEVDTPVPDFQFFDHTLNQCHDFRKQYQLGPAKRRMVQKLPASVRGLANVARLRFREQSREAGVNAARLAAVDRALQRVRFLAEKYYDEVEVMYGRGQIPKSQIFCGNLNCQRHHIAGDRISPNAPPPWTCGICDPMTLLMGEDSRVVPQGGEIWRADAVAAFSYGISQAQREAISARMMEDLENTPYNPKSPSPEPGFFARLFGSKVAPVTSLEPQADLPSPIIWNPSTGRYDVEETLFTEVARAELAKKYKDQLKQPARRIPLFGKRKRSPTPTVPSRPLAEIEKDVVGEQGSRPKKLRKKMDRVAKAGSPSRKRIASGSDERMDGI